MSDPEKDRLLKLVDELTRRVTELSMQDKLPPAAKDKRREEKTPAKVKARFREYLDTMHDAPEDYFPEDYGKAIPETGAWIRISESPGTEITVPPLSMWYALPWIYKGTRPYPMQRVKIITPEGTLGIWPHEYTLVADITQYLGIEAEGCYLRFLDGDSGLNEEHLFYLRSRGIAKRDAELMLLKDLKSQNYCWFEMHPSYASFFDKEWPEPKVCPFAMQADEAERQAAQELKAERRSRRRTTKERMNITLEVK